jgi:hypothetical protein
MLLSVGIFNNTELCYLSVISHSLPPVGVFTLRSVFSPTGGDPPPFCAFYFDCFLFVLSPGIKKAGKTGSDLVSPEGLEPSAR